MKPMIFNTENVIAILDNRKTVTRRVIKPQPLINICHINDSTLYGYWMGEHCQPYRPPYQTGDVLYVRETWSTQQSNDCFGNTTEGCPYDSCETAQGPCFPREYIYKATDKLDSSIMHWRPSIHMPKDAARIFMRVTDVRVERLQDMRLADCLKEGVTLTIAEEGDRVLAPIRARERFSGVWDSMIKKSDLDKYGWEANPFVWVIEFERISREEALNNDE